MQSSAQHVLQTSVQWLSEGRRVELVTVARTWGSSPRPPGSIAAVRDDGTLVGSVSGGCVEKQLSEQFKGQDHARVHLHKVDDEQAKRFGLACGGELELVYETLEDAAPLQTILDALQARERVTRTLSMQTLDAVIAKAERSDVFSWDGEVLQQVFGSCWRVLIVGAGELSRYTAEFAKALDFEVVVVEPRPEFHAAWSLDGVTLLSASPDDAVIDWAVDAQSAVLALTHDPNLDDMALMEALPSNAFYVGALGSTRNYKKRCVRLEGLDVPTEAIKRLKGPIGLPIGSRTSAEIAISIMAELIQVRQKIS